MAAVIGLDEAPTREVCAEAGVVLANLNCPGQLVISGESEKILQGRRTGQGQRGAARHSPAGRRGVSFAAHGQRATKVAGGTGESETCLPPSRAGDFQRDRATTRQLRTRSARGWSSKSHRRCVGRNPCAICCRKGFTRFIELGPGTALSGFHEAHQQERADAQRGGCGKSGGDGEGVARDCVIGREQLRRSDRAARIFRVHSVSFRG